jgi:micrococcal nuclease
MRFPTRSGIAAGLAVATLTACSGASPEATPQGPVRAVAPMGETLDGVRVSRVVDGDTVRVRIGEEDVPVRLIGLDTPETVKPDAPVECFGPEASEYATAMLDGQTVVLEFDDTQGRRDRYDRVLAYVWRVLPDGSMRLFNEEVVASGHAIERQYGAQPYAWRDALVSAQDAARQAGLGLWDACGIDGGEP